MKDPRTLLLALGSIGAGVAVVHAIVRAALWNEPPQLAAFIDILLSFSGIFIAIKVAQIAFALPAAEVSDVDKFYFLLGAVATLWVSVASVIRRFAKPPNV